MEMLEAVVRSICRKTREPEIFLEGEEYQIRVCGEDQGRLIGTRGIGFWALNAISIHSSGLRTAVLEPRDKWFGLKPVAKPNAHWDRDHIRNLAVEILLACTGSADVTLEETGDYDVTLRVTIDRRLESKLTEESTHFPEALEVLLRSAGKADGVMVKTEVVWK